jgi:aryl-alcohol dehydrogenase-like predicted oxidoreductase
MTTKTKLGLGGHSFIAPLGNDPPASFDEQCAIVSACLDAGVTWIDTTYYQERVALGRILQHLGRRDETRIMAWNFFRQPGKEEELSGFTPYEPHHLEIMLEELQTDWIDLLVIHVHGDPERRLAELELARQWVSRGRVRQVALGMAQRKHLDQLQPGHPVTHVLSPYNAFHRESAETFARARELGLATVALSPFVRGWKLDEIGEDKEKAAGLLLRWTTAQDCVDHVIVSMRRREWVAQNLEAERNGPLTDAEQARLSAWLARVN